MFVIFSPVGRCEAETFDCADFNPCEPSLCTPGKTHYSAHNATQYILCHPTTSECYVRPCPASLIWDDNNTYCTWPHLVT